MVKFTRSKVTKAWSEGDGTLLAFVETHGLLPDYGCRSGQCDSCKVKLSSDTVSYKQQPQPTLNNNEALLCCAMPAETTDNSMVKIE